jgi:hypothetical protein
LEAIGGVAAKRRIGVSTRASPARTLEARVAEDLRGADGAAECAAQRSRGQNGSDCAWLAIAWRSK